MTAALAGPTERWTEPDITAAKELYQKGSTFSDIARTLGNHTKSGTRYILIKRGIAPPNGKASMDRVTKAGTKHRRCSRCREDFLPKSPFLFTCDPCKESLGYKSETSTPW